LNKSSSFDNGTEVDQSETE